MGVSWGPDDTIVFGQATQGIWQVRPSGGKPQVLIPRDPEKNEFHHGPQILPGGKAVLFTIRPSSTISWNNAQIVVQSLETGERRVLVEGGIDARYLPTGHLVYWSDGTLLAAAFDLTSTEITSAPVPIVEGVMQSPGNSGATQFSFSSLGSLVYVGSDVREIGSTLVWVNRQGEVQEVTESYGLISSPRISPDGTRLSVTLRISGEQNIWIYEVARGILTPFTFEADPSGAIWTPNGKRLTFHTHKIGEDIFWRAADGTGEAEQLTTSKNTQLPHSWAPDGTLAYSEVGDIWVLKLEGERKPQKFLATPFSEVNAMFSPDGRWIAFTSNRSGQQEVYVKPYPGEGRTTQVSTDGGNQPMWAGNGRELFYRNEDKMLVVPVQTEPTFRAEPPNLLFQGSYDNRRNPPVISNYDVTPDGQRFLMVRSAGRSTPGQINVVLNWFEELKRLVPTN